MDDLEAAQHLRAEILSAFISQQFKVQDEALAWVEAFWRKKQPSHYIHIPSPQSLLTASSLIYVNWSSELN